ncbi:protein DpdH [Salinispora arenicola]|uniref:protein DpdH n=1 Tax=Salinispora arenicola TaxID=168697 RepID=UPI00036D2CB0|nr:protein DpdH [Salinispora arenicola]
MAEFRRFRCWDPLIAADTISTEAVSPSPAVFFATHAPLRIRRSVGAGGLSESASVVDEATVLRDFLQRRPANGVLLMPVIGESGTGKSHLVRWAHAKIPATDRHHVIYLPKTRTSLKAVIQALLTGVSSGPLAQLAIDVDRLSAEVDQAGLEQRLLNQMQEALAAAEPSTSPVRALAGPKGLAVLLLDPHVREHLLSPHRLIPRLAAHLLADRRGGDGDRPLTFTVDDLPLDIADVKAASALAQKMLGMLHSRPEWQTHAVELLNRHLDVAVMNATNLGVGRLQRALIDIRRELAAQGKEILLLIEDFALIQGVQRDLLDAVIEAGVRDGQTVLAPIRTLMAVTTGYYQRLVDTVLTRAKAATPYVYDLDVQFDPSDTGFSAIESFVGRYLNAARLGREELDRLQIRSADEVPNACEDCLMRAQCHPGFGISAEGFGLYPFNRPALRHAIDARAPSDKLHVFNPRVIVGEVVRNVLVEHGQSLVDGTFPDARFRQEYPLEQLPHGRLTSAVRNAVDSADATDAERRTTFLEFWGDTPAQLTDLSPVLHDAFGLDLLHLDPETESGPSPRAQPTLVPPATTRPGATAASDLPPSVRRLIDDVEQWGSRGQRLGQRTAGELRNILSEAVLRRFLWNQPLMAEPSADVLKRAWLRQQRSTIVSIEGAEGENAPGTDQAPIKFKRYPANAVFFQGLLEARAGKVAGNAEHLRRLAGLADRHRVDLVRRVQLVQATTDDRLVEALRASVIGASLAGKAWPGMTEADLLDVALDDGQTWARTDAASRVPGWLQTWERHRTARPALVATIRAGAGISRGTGSIRMIDAARILPLLHAATENWTWPPPPGDLPDVVKKAVGGFSDWETLVDRQIAALDAWRGHVRSLLPQHTRGPATAKAVAAALDAAIPVALAPSSDGDQFRQRVDAAEKLDWRCVEQLERDLERARAGDQPDAKQRQARIQVAVRDRGADMADLLAFLEASDRWLTDALARARLRTNSVAGGVSDRIRDLLRQWQALAGEEVG